MDSVVINITEQIDEISISVVQQDTNVNIAVTEQVDSINVAATSQIDEVTVNVTEQVAQVTINIVESIGGGGAVDSVNGETGVVVLTTGDISEDTDFNYISDAEKVVVQNTSNTNTGDQDLSGKEDVGVAQGIMDTHEANHPVPTIRDSRNQIAGDYEPLKGADDNYVTDAEKIVIGNTSGTNSGDQDISGIATNAGDISDIQDEQVIQNDAIGLNTAKVSNVSTNLSEGTATETTVDVNSSDGTNATLAAASTLRAGVFTKAKFDEVEVNNAKTGITAQQSSDITTNNAKETNATHSGDATGATVLTLANTTVTPGTYSWPEVTVDSKGRITDVRDAPYIHLTKSTTQTSSMTLGTTTLVLWEIELHKDTGFTHDNVTNNSEIQVDADGLYKLEHTLDMQPLTGSVIVYYTYYVINGVTTVLRGRTWEGSRGQFQGLTLFAQTEITLTAGDYIEIYYYVSYSIASGNNTLNIEGTELTLRKIG